jgi:hypothetical protein
MVSALQIYLEPYLAQSALPGTADKKSLDNFDFDHNRLSPKIFADVHDRFFKAKTLSSND